MAPFDDAISIPKRFRAGCPRGDASLESRPSPCYSALGQCYSDLTRPWLKGWASRETHLQKTALQPESRTTLVGLLVRPPNFPMFSRLCLMYSYPPLSYETYACLSAAKVCLLTHALGPIVIHRHHAVCQCFIRQTNASSTDLDICRRFGQQWKVGSVYVGPEDMVLLLRRFACRKSRLQLENRPIGIVRYVVVVAGMLFVGDGSYPGAQQQTNGSCGQLNHQPHEIPARNSRAWNCVYLILKDKGRGFSEAESGAEDLTTGTDPRRILSLPS